MEDYLERITDTVRDNLRFPSQIIPYGFDQQLDGSSLREITDCNGSTAGAIGDLSAIDGGSSTILKTPTQALVLNRVYCNHYKQMEKLAQVVRSTFISRTEVQVEGGTVYFETEVYPQEGPCPLGRIKVESMDEGLKIGKTRGDLERAISMARRFCEWKFVFEALRWDPEFVVMDGSLQTAFTGEAELANEVYDAVAAKGLVVGGLSKSSTIYTKEGYPLAGFLIEKGHQRGLTRWIADLGRSEEWAHGARVFFTRLHDGADRAYRLDVFDRAGDGEVDQLVKALQSNSRYFAYPGYPYALIDAHTYAKVAQEEAMHIRDLIRDRLSLEEATKLEQVERALTGHDVLDKLH